LSAWQPEFTAAHQLASVRGASEDEFNNQIYSGSGFIDWPGPAFLITSTPTYKPVENKGSMEKKEGRNEGQQSASVCVTADRVLMTRGLQMMG
jgi:hypothetical protein